MYLLTGCLALASSLERGVELRTAGDLAAAEHELEALAAEEPSARAWVELAVTRSWAKNLDGALEAYEEALRLDPGSLPAAVGRARVMAWSGERRQAERELSTLPGPEASAELARVQLSRMRLRAARRTIAGVALDDDPTVAKALQERLQQARPTQLTVSGAFGSATGRFELTGSHAVSGVVTARAGVRVGQPLTDVLGSGVWSAEVGATFAQRGTWFTPSLRWESGLWAQGDVAVRSGPCVPGLGATVRIDGTAARFQAGLRCAAQVGYLASRVFLSVGPSTSQAASLEVGTSGTWRVHARGVVLAHPSGGTVAVGAGYEGAAWGFGLEGSVGRGVVAGVGLAATARIRW